MRGHIAPPHSKCKVINNEFLSHSRYPRGNSGQAGRDRPWPTETWGRSPGKEYDVASKEDSTSAVTVPKELQSSISPEATILVCCLINYTLKEKGCVWLTIPDSIPSLQRGQGDRNVKQLVT